MKTRSLLEPNAREGRAPLPRWIEVTDLMGTPASRPLWRRRAGRPAATDRPGKASPMGFWLTEVHEPAAKSSGAPLRIEFVTHADANEEEPTHPPVEDRYRRVTRVTRIKGANATDGDLVLTVTPDGARVVASPATWEHFADPVLLAVCQYWRFARIDVQLDRLTEQAEQDVAHATMSVPSTLWNRARLLHTAREARTLLLDLPHFMEPLTDPFSFCTSERSAQAYRSLAERLNLPDWSEAIDDRAEMVEDTYACVTEKLFEYRNFAWGAFLEVTIVVILLAELLFQVWQHFTGS